MEGGSRSSFGLIIHLKSIIMIFTEGDQTMTLEQEAYLAGFLHASRRPGSPTIHHRDKEVMEEAAKFLYLACDRRKIPHSRLHHPERPLHGVTEEAMITLPPEIIKEIDLPLSGIFDRFRSYQSHLERGILEGCGTLCYKKSTRGMGISFTSFDPKWLEYLREEVSRHHPSGPIQKTERGSRWFGIEENAAKSYADWLYGDPNAPHSKARRRKLQQILGALKSEPPRLS